MQARTGRLLTVALTVAGLGILGVTAIAWGVWQAIGSARVAIVGDQLLFGKMFKGIWFKKTYDLDELTDIRHAQRKKELYPSYVVGFFIKGQSKPLLLKGYDQEREEVDWLVSQLYPVWQQNVAE